MTARGNEQKSIFRDHRVRQHFLELMAKMVSRFRVRLHSFVLMDNHYHLLLELTEANLSRAVQWLNVSFSIVQLAARAQGAFVSGPVQIRGRHPG